MLTSSLENVPKLKVAGVVELSGWAPSLLACKALCQGDFRDKTEGASANDAVSGKSIVFDSTAAAAEGTGLWAGYVEKVVASTYFKHQTKFLSDHLQKPNSGDSQSVAVTLKSLLREANAILEEVNFSGALVSKPTAAEAKRDGWCMAFNSKFKMFKERQFVGVTNFCAGECFVGLQGSFKMAGVRVGKLDGDLKKQLATLSDLTTDHIRTETDV